MFNQTDVDNWSKWLNAGCVSIVLVGIAIGLGIGYLIWG